MTIKGMRKCKECGQWYFSQKKLTLHLIKQHDYELVLEEVNNVHEEKHTR